MQTLATTRNIVGPTDMLGPTMLRAFAWAFNPRLLSMNYLKSIWLAQMKVGFFIFLNLFVKRSVDETNCENLCGAKPCELVSLSNRDLAESRKTCTMWFNIHLHYVLPHPLLSLLSRLSCASPQSTVLVHHQSLGSLSKDDVDDS